MTITRHYVRVGDRMMHYRKAGSGPPLLMAHQSPRSSAEYAPLIERWSAHFTCIAPDTPGFGQSDPLPGALEICDFGDALIGFLDALGLDRVAAYGFHSGGIILMNALRRHPARFAALAIGGYAIWTPAEAALLGDAYLPPFRPSAYGEHLTWLWSRVLEQSWVFPWYDVRPEARLSLAHDDPARVDSVVREMLDAGDAYRAGYGAVLRAPRDIPPPDAETPPVLIAAYDGDPLQPHIDRLGPMPANWRAEKVRAPADLEAAALAHLRAAAVAACPPLADDPERGFLPAAAAGFDGLVHWRRLDDAPVMRLHGPGESLEFAAGSGIAIDLPGHGLSDGWIGPAPADPEPWRAVVRAVAERLDIPVPPLPARLAGEAARLFPDLTPDRFGAYLTCAWGIVRARHLFVPWYRADAAHARPFDPAALAPDRLAVEHRALLRAGAARAYAIALEKEHDDGNS